MYICIMIKRIYHISDLHIKRSTRFEEYAEQLDKLKDYITEDSKKYKAEECRIVLCGDICDSKINITNEQIAMASTFLRELESICEVIVISGNHDQIVGNSSRLDTLTAIFTAANFQNAVHLDGYLGYDSGLVVEDNITWALYSIFSDFKKPNVEQARIDYPNNVIIGLYHGSVVGSTLNNGTVIENGTNGDVFEGCDYVMAGDIHKRQVIKKGDCEIVYPGSLIQQTFGETITQHGIMVWSFEMDENGKQHVTYDTVDFENDYSLYDFEISTPEDIEEDKELLNNF